MLLRTSSLRVVALVNGVETTDFSRNHSARNRGICSGCGRGVLLCVTKPSQSSHIRVHEHNDSPNNGYRQGYLVESSISVASSSLHSSSTATSQIRTSTSQRAKWITSNVNVISYSQAASYAGQSKTVEGTIVHTYVSGGTVFLDFHYPFQGYFYAVIFSSSVGNFKFQPASFYLNKEVRITGLIQMYQGAPEIIVNTPSQIEVANMGFNYP